MNSKKSTIKKSSRTVERSGNEYQKLLENYSKLNNQLETITTKYEKLFRECKKKIDIMEKNEKVFKDLIEKISEDYGFDMINIINNSF